MHPESSPVRTRLRVAGPGDAAFLRRLFAATRPEFDTLPPDLAESIVAQQYELRERQYRARHPTMVDEIVEADGASVGRVSHSSSEWGAEVIVVDLAMLPGAQGRGIGSSVLAELCARADRRRAAIELSVAVGNPAVRLYERFGFLPAADPAEAALYLRMRRTPS